METTYEHKLWKKLLSVFLAVIIGVGTFVTLTFGNSRFQKWLGIESVLSAYAQEIVDTKGAIAIDEESMLADNHIIDLENRDGSNTVYVLSEPISYVDENGKLKTKDISVEKQTDKELKSKGFDYTNGQNDYRINFSSDSSKGLYIEFGNSSYTIIPKGSVSAIGEKSTSEILNEGFQDFEYKNIYGDGTNLKFYPQLNGVKDEIVLNSNIGRYEFSFEICTANCKAVLNDDGTVSLISNDDESSVQTFSTPFAYDSEYVEGDMNEHYIDCSYSLEQIDANTYLITVHIDRDWLENDNTVYPITIDPTTSNLSNYRDAGIYSKSSVREICYGKEPLCCFGRASEYGYGRVLNQFTMPDAIKKGATINSAYSWQRETTGRTTSTKVTPYIVTSSWAEGTVTWEDRPSFSTSTSGTTRTISSKSTDDPDNPYWYKFNIKNLVKKWADGTSNYGFIFKSSEEDDGNYNWRAFASKQYSTSSMRPYTVINYTNDTTAPTVTSVTGNPTSWTNSSVTLTVNGAADNSGGAGLHSTPYSFSTTKGSYSWQSGKTKTFSSNCTVYVYVRDAIGNIRLVSTQTINKIDKTAPSTPNVTGNPTSWTNSNVTLTASSSDSASGVKYYSFSTTAGSYSWQTSSSKTFGANTTVYVYAKDNAGNISSAKTVTISKIDKTAPTAPNVTENPTSWTNSSVTLTASSSDSASGVKYYSFSTTAGSYSWQTSTSKSFSSNCTVYVYAKDDAGNVSSPTTFEIKNIDKTAPTANSVTGNPTDWTNSDVILTINGAADNGVGLNSSPYSFSSSQNSYNWQTSNSKTFTDNQIVYVYIRDALTNSKLLDTVNINKIDKVAPTLNISKTSGNATTTITATATDEESGIKEYSFDNGITWQTENYCTIDSNFANYITVKVKDTAGNITEKLVDLAQPEFYTDGTLVGIVNPVINSNEIIKYKIGEDGEWENYTIPFTVTLFEETTVYARVGSGAVTSMVIQPDTSSIGAYTESNIDFSVNYRNVNFDFVRNYSSTDNKWFYSTNSKLTVINDNIISAALPDGTKMSFVKTNDNIYKNEINGYTLSQVGNGYVIKINDTNYYYGADGYISSIGDKYDNRINITRSDSSIVVSYADRNYTIHLNSDGDITSITDPAGNDITYTYNGSNLTSVVDQAGVTLGQYNYNDDGKMSKSMFTNIAYKNGRVSKLTEDSGAYVDYIYNDDEYTISTESSTDRNTTEKYNDALMTVSSTDEDGNTTEYTYDEYYRILTEAKDGKTVTYSYDSNGNLVSEIFDDEEAENTYYTYDSNNNVIRQQTGDSYTYYVYNGNGNNTVVATLKEGYEGNIPDKYNAELNCFDTVEYTFENGLLIKTVNSKENKTITYTYDAYGNELQVSTLNSTNNDIISIVNCTYDIMGNLLTSVSGEETSSFTYDKAGRTLLVNDKGDCTRTIYDNLGRTIQEVSPDDYDSSKDGLPDSNTYSDANAGQTYKYAANGTLTSETNRLGKTTKYFYNDIGSKVREEFDIYKFYYLNHGELEKVKVADNTTVSYNYDNDYKLLSETYLNDDVIRYTYNENGDIIAQYHNSNANPYVTYTYNDDGELTVKENTDTGLRYEYDGDNVSVYKTSDNTLVQSYSSVETDANEETNAEAFTTVSENHFGTAYSSVIKDKSVTYTSGNNSVAYSYQTNGDENNEKFTSDFVTYNGSNVLSSLYEYDDKDNITQKNIACIVNGNEETVSIINSYDDKGRISATGYGGELNTTYTYDNNDQIVRVNCQAAVCYTSSYTYDDRGNITSKKVFDYTASDTLDESNLTESTAFVYANSGWKDKLVSVNGVELEYDEIGNVTSYGDKEFSWNTGRFLESIVDGDNEYSYTYDENGIRTSKSVNSVTTYYNTKNGVILSQTDGTNTMYFQYDTNGVPLGFIYNGTQYFYITNIVGDVIGITDANGNALAEYAYDEWGKVLDILTVDSEDEDSLNLAKLNPIRYRGYYYDNETDYYYLQSRYYDPNLCRFINADIPEIAQISKDVPYGANLFSYCDNDPINNSDPTGAFGTPIQWACAIIGALLGLPFGKWLANKLGYYSGAKYITIRAAAVVGGAALGWFAGTLLIKLVKSYLTSHPEVPIKIVAKYGPKTLLRFKSLFGLSTTFVNGSLYREALNRVISNKVTHIMQTKHLWSKIGAKSWSQVSKAILYVLENGKSEPYKAGSRLYSAKYLGVIVQVQLKIVNDVYTIVDAWVKR